MITWAEWVGAKNWISSPRGTRIYPSNPEASDWTFGDIAHNLARECRYGGAGEFYSVAEHSVRVSAILRQRGELSNVQLAGLLHDGAEAFLRDLPRPVKKLPAFSAYAPMEAKWTRAILERVGLPGTLPAVVHEVDTEILANEVRNIFPRAAREIEDIPAGAEEVGSIGWGWRPEQAEEIFLGRLASLGVKL